MYLSLKLINYTILYSKLVIDFLPEEEKEKPVDPTQIENKINNLDIAKMVLNVDETKLV